MLYPDLLKSIFNHGHICKPHGYECRELMHVRLEVTDPIYYWVEHRPLEKLLDYWHKEWAWYMSGERSDASRIAKAAKMWDNIKNEDGSLNSNYGYLVFYHKTPHPSMGEITLTPFEWAKKCLISDQATRQAIITYNSGGYNFLDNRDYICTQHQAFYIRENKLLCYIALRSSDAIFGLPYNMPWWTFVAQQLLLALKPFYPDVELAPLEVDIYSAHIYSRHYELVEKLISQEPKTYHFESRETPLGLSLPFYLDNFERLICLKK